MSVRFRVPKKLQDLVRGAPRRVLTANTADDILDLYLVDRSFAVYVKGVLETQIDSDDSALRRILRQYESKKHSYRQSEHV